MGVAVTTEAEGTVAPSMVAEDMREDAVTMVRATMAGASVSAYTRRPATDTLRRPAILQASTTKAAIGIIILVAQLRRTDIRR